MSDLPTNSPDTFGAASHSGEDSVMSALNLLDIAPDTDPHRPRPGVQRVLSGDGANLVLFSFAPGQSLPDHKAAHPITVQALRGELDFSYGSETITLTPALSCTFLHMRYIRSRLQARAATLPPPQFCCSPC